MTNSAHRFVDIDLGQPVTSVEERITAHTLYGKGVFTTIAVHAGEPFLWQKHWRRLEENSVRIGMDLSRNFEESAKREVDDLIRANEVRNGRLRLTFSDETAVELWPNGGKGNISLLIMTADFKPAAENFKLTVSLYLLNSTSPLAGVKSCNYLEKVIAKDESKKRGFDEAIQLNERDEVTSACMANVFWLKDGKLFTPSLATGCLPGTTREHILENIDCVEVESGIEDLRSADDIFLTSAGIGVVQVAEFEGRSLQRDDHAIINLLPSRS